MSSEQYFNLSSCKKLNAIIKINTEVDLEIKKNNLKNNLNPTINKMDNFKKLKKNSLNSNKLIKMKNKFNNSLNNKDLGERLRKSCFEKLILSQFRTMNEYLYSNSSTQAIKYVNDKLFKQYHNAYAKIVDKWPVKPIDVIKEEIKKLKIDSEKKFIIADMGCGEAHLSEYFNETNKQYNTNVKVYSFDLISIKNCVTQASMDNVPLGNNVCDVVVFCLSLMPINLRDCFIEANRILKLNGYIFIIEVSSRFENDGKNKFEEFKCLIEKFNFKIIKQTYLKPNNYFVLFKLKKNENLNQTYELPSIQLKPCKYKIR